MHDHGPGRCLIERRCIASVVQKTHFIRARRLQRGHPFEQQFDVGRDPTGRARNHGQRVWSTSAKEPGAAQSRIWHGWLPGWPTGSGWPPLLTEAVDSGKRNAGARR